MQWLLPGILLLWLLYPWLLQLLFSREFIAAPELLPWQLAGDYFRSSTCVFAVLMLALGHTRFYFWLEMGSSVFMLVAVWMLYPMAGFASLFIVHAVRYFLYWLVIVLRYRQIFF
jgi:PST family polysaccharide transporter